MKLTVRQLRRIIKEEVYRIVEGDGGDKLDLMSEFAGNLQYVEVFKNYMEHHMPKDLHGIDEIMPDFMVYLKKRERQFNWGTGPLEDKFTNVEEFKKKVAPYVSTMKQRSFEFR